MLTAVLALAGGAVRAQTTTVRTLVYHQISSFTTSPNSGAGQSPVLSDSGNRIVFAMAPGTGDAATPNRIFVVNPDGTGQREVDSYTSLGFAGSMIDISADGSRVISTEGVQLRIANSDSGGGRPLLTLTDGEFRFIRIAGNGTRVFFQTRRDTTIRGTNTLVQRGLWVINADGGGLRQIAGPTQVAALLSISADTVFPFHTNGPSMDISADGNRCVFGTIIGANGEGVFAVNADGSGLRQVSLGRLDFVNHAGLSADGVKIFYDVTPNPFSSTPSETGVINFAGGGRRPLATSATRWPRGYPASDDPMGLSGDGSQLLFGSTGVLIDTATGTMLQLSAPGNPFSTTPPSLLTDGMARATMNADATRFVYLAGDINGRQQIATLDINPSNRGSAPALSDAQVQPPFILTNGRSTATVSVRVAPTAGLDRVDDAVLRDGLQHIGVTIGQFQDNGANGDATAGDGIFADNRMGTRSEAVPGPHTVRLQAELRTGDGRRHAAAVDLEPFAVLADPPPPTGPHPLIAVYRPNSQQWFLRAADGGVTTVQFGGPDDRPVPADYLATGKAQIAVFRTTTRQWFIRTGTGGLVTIAFGGPGDVPVPADYFGLRRVSIAIFRPSTREWFLRQDDGNATVITFGGPGDLPVPADYLANGRAQIAVFRPSTRQWFIRNDQGGTVTVQFGNSGDVPVPGDYFGLRRAQIAVYRPSTGEFVLRQDSGQALTIPFGAPGDLPVPRDYREIGRLQLAVFRPGTAEWLFRQDDGTPRRIQFGGPTDQPLPVSFAARFGAP